MHLASEVTSTTNHVEKTGNSTNNSANSANNNNNNNTNAPLTAETLLERTIDGLLAEHPGELVRTGCPHVVRSFSSTFNQL